MALDFSRRHYTLDSLVQETHKHNCEVNGWQFKPLLRGAFGYDNLCLSIAKLLDCNQMQLTDEKAAEIVHDGWVQNYLYWRDNSPWTNTSVNPIGDERRDKCAATKFIDLPQEEKDKDFIISNFILKKMIEALEDNDDED